MKSQLAKRSLSPPPTGFMLLELVLASAVMALGIVATARMMKTTLQQRTEVEERFAMQPVVDGIRGQVFQLLRDWYRNPTLHSYACDMSCMPPTILVPNVAASCVCDGVPADPANPNKHYQHPTPQERILAGFQPGDLECYGDEGHDTPFNRIFMNQLPSGLWMRPLSHWDPPPIDWWEDSTGFMDNNNVPASLRPAYTPIVETCQKSILHDMATTHPTWFVNPAGREAKSYPNGQPGVFVCVQLRATKPEFYPAVWPAPYGTYTPTTGDPFASGLPVIAMFYYVNVDVASGNNIWCTDFDVPGGGGGPWTTSKPSVGMMYYTIYWAPQNSKSKSLKKITGSMSMAN